MLQCSPCCFFEVYDARAKLVGQLVCHLDSRGVLSLVPYQKQMTFSLKIKLSLC